MLSFPMPLPLLFQTLYFFGRWKMRMICRRLTNLQGGNLISSAVRWLTNLQEGNLIPSAILTWRGRGRGRGCSRAVDIALGDGRGRGLDAFRWRCGCSTHVG